MGLFRQHKERLGVDGLRLADAYTVARETPGARLTHADPPWLYRNAGTSGKFNGAAAGVYGCESLADVARDLNAAFDSAAPDSYLTCWITFPILVEEIDAMKHGRGKFFPLLQWRLISAGAWFKATGIGIGFHWRGDSEPLLLLGKGKPHYDIPKRRIAEISAKCRLVAGRDILEIVKRGCPP